MGVFSVFFLLDENVTLILCDNLLFQSINRINSACKISFDHRACGTGQDRACVTGPVFNNTGC